MQRLVVTVMLLLLLQPLLSVTNVIFVDTSAGIYVPELINKFLIYSG